MIFVRPLDRFSPWSGNRCVLSWSRATRWAFPVELSRGYLHRSSSPLLPSARRLARDPVGRREARPGHRQVPAADEEHVLQVVEVPDMKMADQVRASHGVLVELHVPDQANQ
jgi:hypothetical protein